jgi:hypothetical protein
MLRKKEMNLPNHSYDLVIICVNVLLLCRTVRWLLCVVCSSILWNHHCLLGTNVHRCYGSPLLEFRSPRTFFYFLIYPYKYSPDRIIIFISYMYHNINSPQKSDSTVSVDLWDSWLLLAIISSINVGLWDGDCYLLLSVDGWLLWDS